MAAIISYGTSGLDALEASRSGTAAEGMPVEVHDGRFAAPWTFNFSKTSPAENCR